jgi:light-regulated signal transduction histidine kinase (bacteriophytochrome)
MRNIPFVFYTATYTEKKDEELGLSLGASRFILKPVEPERFLEMVRQVIDEAQKGELKLKQPLEDQEILLRTYHYRLARKLDSKVAELEAVSRDLRAAAEAREHELAQRRRAEAEVRALNAELENRVKARTAELAIANRGLEAFVAAVSHDLRSPLHRINGLIEILIEKHAKELTEGSRECLNRIVTESRNVANLVEALLELSRATDNTLHIEKLDLSQIASEIAGDLQQQQPDRRVEFLIARGLFANGDPVLFRAALQNLLENAWKFTSRKEHSRIEFGVVAGERRAYFVRDNGAGFESHRAAEVFTAFNRLHSYKDFPGSGIGLATVHQIISRHGGQIWAEAAPEQGATFYFTLA